VTDALPSSTLWAAPLTDPQRIQIYTQRSGPANPSTKGRNPTGTMGAGISAFQGVPFVLGQSAPDSCVLAGVDGPTQAGLHDLTATADNSCLFELVKRWVGVSYREEQLRVLV
jgi:hypothetical protein